MKKFRVTIIVENLSEYEQVPGMTDQTTHVSIGTVPNESTPAVVESMSLSRGEKFQREFVIEARHGRAFAPLLRHLLVY